MKTSFRYLFAAAAILLLTLLHTTTATAQEVPELYDIFPEEKLFADPDFPMSKSEISAFFTDINTQLTTLRPKPGFKFELIDGSDRVITNYFNMEMNKIVFNRRLGPIDLEKLTKSKKNIDEFQYYFRDLLAHEYGHALLHRVLLSRPEIAEFMAKIFALQNSHASAAGNEDTIAMLTIQTSFQELFGDLLTSLYRNDPYAIPKATRYAYETDVEYFRSFRVNEYNSKGLTFLEEFGGETLGNNVNEYAVYFPIRHIIWSRIQKLTAPQKKSVLSDLANAFADLVVEHLKRPVSELTVSELNRTLEAKILATIP